MISDDKMKGNEMLINKINVKNFRLLKDFTLELKNDLSLIVGKNNAGKTSVITLLEKVLNRGGSKSLKWEDINIDHRKVLHRRICEILDSEQSEKSDLVAVTLQIWIEYSEEDSYRNLQSLMMDLNPNNNFIVLQFEYKIPKTFIEKMKTFYDDFKQDFNQFESLIKQHLNDLFIIEIYSLGYDIEKGEATDEKSELIELRDVKKVIKISGISANREVSNKENNHSLSKLSNRYYKLNDGDSVDLVHTDRLLKAINDADELLTKAYSGDRETPGVFSGVFESLKKFGSDTESEITIRSSLSEKELLTNNTTVYYKHDDSTLPESYNGLGYLNLYGMIFEVETVMTDVKNDPADINLIYIEEPESHTHPQLQYIFIKNIKDLVEEHRKGLISQGNYLSSIQTLITTHSSHIISVCDFNDIIYFKREKGNIVARPFNQLEEIYGDEQSYKFVKQYLTLNSSELFFADKVICIEGTTERILITQMMNKIEKSNPVISNSQTVPLLSQNISILETGAHSHIFKHLFSFLGLKVLIITDIDPAKKDSNKSKSCPASEATITTNASIKDFFNYNTAPDFEELTKKKSEEKISSDGLRRIAYQTKGADNYQPASFEDAFISVNKEFLIQNKEGLISYGATSNFTESSLENVYKFAHEKVKKKSAFASSILYYESEDSQWKIPEYIKEGLLWLRE